MNIIKQYIKDRKQNRVGVVLAFKEDNDVYIGWSRANINAGDRFNKDFGDMIAKNRAKTGSNKQIPHDFKPVIENIARRAKSYFKGCNIIYEN